MDEVDPAIGKLGPLAFVYGSRAGIGGLGRQVANAITDLARSGVPIQAVGPGRARDAVPVELGGSIEWHETPQMVSPFAARYTWLRWLTGRRQCLVDQRLGAWAAGQVSKLAPSACYCFTQVALETLRWAKNAGIPTVLENPNGHLRAFREIYVEESRTWCGATYRGHPSAAMVARAEEEYALADVIRVTSNWTRDSMIAGGVPASKIVMRLQRPDLIRFRPPDIRPTPTGPLRICFVGTLDLRKGFPYLLRALREFGPERVSLRIVGGTVDRATRLLLERESATLKPRIEAGDPREAYQQSELLVVPTLEDGGPFVVAEGIACGLPVIVTDQCGNQEFVRHRQTGWVIKARSIADLRDAIAEAINHRAELPEMGRLARIDLERVYHETIKQDLLKAVFPARHR